MFKILLYLYEKTVSLLLNSKNSIVIKFLGLFMVKYQILFLFSNEITNAKDIFCHIASLIFPANERRKIKNSNDRLPTKGAKEIKYINEC